MNPSAFSIPVGNSHIDGRKSDRRVKIRWHRPDSDTLLTRADQAVLATIKGFYVLLADGPDLISRLTSASALVATDPRSHKPSA